MNFKKVGLAFATAFAAGIIAAACGGAGTLGGACTTDGDCTGNNEICHPTAKVCAQTCTTSSPGSCDTGACTQIPGQPSGNGVCSCSSDASCTGAFDGMTCATSANPPVCVTGTGGGLPDAGPGQTCSGEGQSTCNYGQFCNNGTCEDVQDELSCVNFQSTTDQRVKSPWSPTTSTGPVIYGTSLDAWGTGCDYQCQPSAPTPVCIRLRAYKASGQTWATSPLNENTPSYFVNEAGAVTEMTKSNAFFSTASGNWVVTEGGRNLSARVRLCVASGTTSQTFGFRFADGNRACPTFSR